MTLYRIYTEDKNEDGVRHLANASLEGYTVLKGIGLWKGIEEHSLILEVIGDTSVSATVQQLAANIKAINQQDSVYITSHDIQLQRV